MSVLTLSRPGKPDLAYQKLMGRPGLPTVVFCHGFRSDMQGTKAQFLNTVCEQSGQSFVRFDYRGHGRSGGVFSDGTIGLWLEDTLAVIDQLTQGPVLLVGSSMGGWLALLAAIARPERITGLIGLAAAPDFTEAIERQINNDQRAALEKDGFFTLPSDYAIEPYVITRRLLDDGCHHKLLDGPIHVACPIRLVQGKRDSDVPWQTAEKLMALLASPDKKLYLLEDGDHRLSAPSNLELLERLVMALSGR